MPIRKICIFHLNQIGDLVFSLPLLKALRESYPGAEIHSVVRPHLGELLQDSPYVTKVIERKGGALNDFRLLLEIRRTQYDLVVSLSDSPSCLMMAGWSRAGLRVGFRNPPWDARLTVKEGSQGYHSADRDLKLLERLNIPVNQRDYVGLLKLRARKEEGRSTEGWRSVIGDRYVVVAPGTSVRRGIKAWEEKKFGELIQLLKMKFGLGAVLVGAEREREVSERVIEEAKRKDKNGKIEWIVNLAGGTRLFDLCDVLRGASLFVGVDSGVMHLASSLGIPVVAIFGPTDPSRVGPQSPKSVVVQKKDLDCIPCNLRGCEERRCLTELEVKDVFDACQHLLRG